MSIESFLNNNKKIGSGKNNMPFPTRHPIIKKKKSKYLLDVTTPFKQQYQESPNEEKYKEEWIKFLNGYSDNRKPVLSTLFSGYSFYFDGYLGEKTRLELAEMVLQHGGDIEHFYSTARVSIIIARNLCFSKEQYYRKKLSIRVIDPSWIVDSVSKQKLQPFTNYSILKEKKNAISEFFIKQIK